MTLSEFNQLSDAEALEQMLKCCYSHRWASEMIAKRPFENIESLKQTAESIWSSMNEIAILEAFSGHPQIGDMKALKVKYSRASAEQGQVQEADPETLQALMDQNARYLDKNGFIFIVCATGKSAEEMLDLLNQRIDNDRQTELKNGAEEQQKITQIRIDALLNAKEKSE